MIFAHGPWWSEWHHIADLWPVLVGGGATIWSAVKFRFFDLFKGDDDD